MGAQLTHQPDLRFPENTAARLSIVVIDPAERTQCRTIRCSTTECKLQCKQKGPQKARKRPAKGPLGATQAWNTRHGESSKFRRFVAFR